MYAYQIKASQQITIYPAPATHIFNHKGSFQPQGVLLCLDLLRGRGFGQGKSSPTKQTHFASPPRCQVQYPQARVLKQYGYKQSREKEVCSIITAGSRALFTKRASQGNPTRLHPLGRSSDKDPGKPNSI